MIEIYGIPKEVYNCWGCRGAVKLLEDLGLPYTFKPVFVPADNELDFAIDRATIEELAGRMGKRSLSIGYPQIFIDNVHIGGYKELREYYDQ